MVARAVPADYAAARLGPVAYGERGNKVHSQFGGSSSIRITGRVRLSMTCVTFDMTDSPVPNGAGVVVDSIGSGALAGSVMPPPGISGNGSPGQAGASWIPVLK